MEPQVAVDCHPFARSRKVLESVIVRLSSPDVMDLQHGDLEDLICSEGRGLLRFLLQDHLDLRGLGHVEDRVAGSDGIARTHVRIKERGLATIVGRVRVRRAGYGKPGMNTLFPLDSELNLPGELYSHGVRKRVAIEASKNSYQETVQTLSDLTGAKVGMRQAEESVARAAQDFEAFYEGRELATPEEVQETGDILTLSTDGKGVVMRHQDLREATRLAAENRNHKLQKRLSRGEKSNSKRMATVATVYTVQPFMRTPEDIVSELRSVEDLQKKQQRPRPEQKRVWASLEREPEQVIEAAFQEALRRDPFGKKKWAVVVDGSETQLAQLLKQAGEHDVAVTIVLDLIHVIEYLWKAVTAFHPEGTKEAESWVTERILEILHGRASNVAAGMRRSATLRALPPKERKAVDTCANYLLKNSPYLRYNEYLAQGLPIASGVIEGACRYLVKDRLDITGARWSLRGAESVLQLRSLRSSGDFEQYWAFHTAQEFARTHASQYLDAVTPTQPRREVHDRPQLRLLT